jgi:class 3 adenylate cyclase/tetratricopeptide (TPR) repeat protein
LKVLSATANYCDSCGTKIEDETTLQSSESTDIHETLERRQMTVMFCDLRDSTRMSEQLDPEDLRQVLRLYQDSCASATQKYGGYVSRYMGDGILTLFGYPTAHDDDAYRAVRAGIDIVSEISSLPIDLSGVPLQLSVRIGIATGVVVSGDVIGEQDSREQTIVGRTPNLASRLQSIADTNGIVVSETTYRLVKSRVRFESVGPIRLHGISTPVNAYRVHGLHDPLPKSVDNLNLPTSLMVDRETELDYLIQEWRRAKKGNGRVVLIQGEAGIGKSRLIQELKTSIDEESHNVLEVRCSSYLTNSSLHPFFELFREYVETGLPELVERISEEDEKQATQIRSLVATVSSAEMINSGSAAPGSNPIELPFNAIIQLLVAISEGKPLLLVVEDFHWVDPSTTQLIDLLVDQVPLEKILVVISSRPESRPQWLTRSHATQLTLDRLNPEDTEAMVYAHAGNSPLAVSLCQIVVKKSDGVPLFIEELTKSILNEQDIKSRNDKNDSVYQLDDLAVPETLRDLLMARLDQIGEAKVIAQFGSAIGRDFTYDMLRVVTNLSEARLAKLLSQLVSSELVFQRGVGSSRRYHFKHSLIQDTAYESLVHSTRIEFHKRIASALENQFPGIGRSQPELMARHYALSGQTAEAVVYWNLASERALQQSANLEALHHASEGLRYVTDLVDGQRRDELLLSLYIHLSTAISGTKGDAVPEVEDIHQKAATVLNRLGNASLAFSLTREMHAYYLIRGPLTRAVELGHRMLELAEDSGDPQILTDSQRCLGWTYICHGELEQGQILIRKALSLYDIGDSRDHTRHDTIDPGGVGMINLAWSEWLAGNSDTAARLARDAVTLSREIDHPYTLAYALCMGAAVFQCRREPEAVLSLVDEVISIAKKRDYRYWIAWGTCLQGWAKAQLGTPELGIQALIDGLKNYRETGATLFIPHILSMTAESQCLVGRHAEARHHLILAADIESNNQIYFYSAETQRLFATVESDLGETESSVTHFQKALDIAKTQKARNFELRIALSIMQSTFSFMIVPDAKKTLASALNNTHEGQDDIDHQIARDLATSE